MKMGTLGTKIGMTQRFDEDGRVVPVTVLEVPPCPIVQKKTKETDGYVAIQVGYGSRKSKRTTKALAGHYKKSGVDPMHRLMEFRLHDGSDGEEYELGGQVGIDLFEKGDYVDVTGRSKGKGFAGVMKRHNFAGKSKTHGTHEFFRHGGAIGMCATPSRLMKGKKMPGRLGGVKTTTQNLRVVDVQKEQNLLFILGAVPGSRNGTVVIRKAAKKKHAPVGK